MHIKCQKQLNSVGRLRGGFGFSSFFFGGGKGDWGSYKSFLTLRQKLHKLQAQAQAHMLLSLDGYNL